MRNPNFRFVGPSGRGVVLAAIVAWLGGCGWAEWPAEPDPAASGGGAAVPQAGVFAPQRPPLRPGTLAAPPTAKPERAAGTAAAASPPAPETVDRADPAPGAPPGAAAAAVVTVEPDDTIYSVSRRYRVSTRTIIDANGLTPPYRLEAGQRLKLPQRRDHIVAPGETMFSLSRLYSVDVATLAGANGLVAPYAIRVGQAIRIPDTANLPAAAPEPVAAATRPAPAPVPAAPRSEPKPLPATVPPATGVGFAWPVDGRLISGFGPKAKGLHNDGVNIAAARGTPIRAAENGVVAYAGNELRGFGNLILVQHAGGWVTAYAHTDTMLVGRGDEVRKGQEIARVGSTGNVDSPQLHFQVRRGTTPVDPARHLPRKR